MKVKLRAIFAGEARGRGKEEGDASVEQCARLGAERGKDGLPRWSKSPKREVSALAACGPDRRMIATPDGKWPLERA